MLDPTQPMLDGAAIRAARAAIIEDTSLSGRALAVRLCRHMDEVLGGMPGLPEGWAIAATGGYANGSLAPGSDIDIVLLHPVKEPRERVEEVAQRLWYPLWDARLKVSPSAQSPKSLVELAREELVAVTSWLDARCVAGDASAVERSRDDVRAIWRKSGLTWLKRLREANEDRWQRCGDVASLLEPDLKDGHGGLRDVDALRWALAVGRDDVTAALDAPIDGLAAPVHVLLAARCEVHRATGRASNVLLLQDQDRAAAALGFDDADDFMLQISSAARSIDWVGDRFWRRVARLGRDGDRRWFGRSPKLSDPIPGVRVADGEVQVGPECDVTDPAMPFRVAATAAHAGVPLSSAALRALATAPVEEGVPWSEATRRSFLSLLGAGDGVVTAVEALEHFGLFSRYLPEWRHVRSRPQRNAFHIYTVDRHLLQTVANACTLVRNVARPDLLLVGALLHDIGKGHPGDHTDVGMELIDVICPRMGFSAEDTATVRSMCEHHLLLAETATRRDLSDPRTAANVAAAVGDLGRLELLSALTEADSRATGPSAWSAWKESLLEQLAVSVEACLVGDGPVAVPPPSAATDERLVGLAAQVRDDGELHLDRDHVGDVEVLRIASRDRRGLFAVIAGTLALHGLDVSSASAFTTGDGVAIDEFQVLRPSGGTPDWAKVGRDLRRVADGTIDLADRLEQRIRTYARSRRPIAAQAPRLEVLVTNDASDVTTMIDVRAPDGIAVLYRLSSTLAAEGLDIRSAKVATLGHEVVDVFYVQRAGDGGGGRLPEVEHAALAERLKAALQG